MCLQSYREYRDTYRINTNIHTEITTIYCSKFRVKLLNINNILSSKFNIFSSVIPAREERRLKELGEQRADENIWS
jgi:hypothetical protein